MNRFIFILFLTIPFIGQAQDQIVLRNGEKIDCKITKVDSSVIYYDFLKGERMLSSFVTKNDIRNYTINTNDSIQAGSADEPIMQGQTVVIDTSKFVKETTRWINLLTYSKHFGVHAKGWCVKYYGYFERSSSRWSIPISFGIEGFDIDPDYFSRFSYSSAAISYYMAGISPFYRLNDSFSLNLGLNFIFGNEEMTDFYGKKYERSVFGLYPTQGIFFIPKSKFGLTVGLGVYEKIINSKFYLSDIGIKLEAGIKF